MAYSRSVGDDLVTTDFAAMLTYRHTGFTDSVHDTQTLDGAGNSARGCDFDADANFIWTEGVNPVHSLHKMTGYTETPLDEFDRDGAGNEQGVCIDSDGDVITVDGASIREYAGFTNSVDDTYDISAQGNTAYRGIAEKPSTGLFAYWQVNFIDGDGGSEEYIARTNSLNDNLDNTFDLILRGADWDGTNRIHAHKFGSIQQYRRFEGFSQTLDVGFDSEGGGNVYGATGFPTAAPVAASGGTLRQRQVKGLSRKPQRSK
jgi:hypothetical protein